MKRHFRECPNRARHEVATNTWKSSRHALPLGLIAVVGLACGASRQARPSETSQQSTQTASEHAPPASDTEPAATSVWGATNLQPTELPRSSMPSSDESTTAASAASPGSGNTANGADENGFVNVAGESELSQLDDAQLAAVVQAFDDGEIRIAQLVEGRTTNDQVKRLAHDLLVSHQSMLFSDKALWSRLHVAPIANAVSARVDADTQNELTLLTSVRGDSFDRDYVELQIRDQKGAIELVGRIVPKLNSASFKAALNAARSRLEGHVRLAESAQESLSAGRPAEAP
jgi:predicted outer membrane protein